MRYLSYRSIPISSYGLIITIIIVQLEPMENIANDSKRRFVLPSQTTFYRPVEDFIPICDQVYRVKYSYRDVAREPYPTVPLNEKLTKQNADAEFLIHDEEYTSEEYIIHERTANKFVPRFPVRDGKTIRCNGSDAIKSNNFDKSLSKVKKNTKFAIIPYYTMLDTFGGIFKSRRDDSNEDDDDSSSDAVSSQTGWANNACKSMRRIVGGWSPHSAEQFPYLVFVDTGCGGSIIGDVWVLTAGHCVDEELPKYVHAGSLDLLGGCQYNVAKVYIHPKFTRQNLKYDIGLLTVTPNFVYSPAIKPIMLSEQRAHYKMCGVVAGWGAEAYQGAAPSHLSMTLIPVVSRKKCHMFGIRRGQFCAGYEDGKADTCQGDSGGPFVVNDYVVGIVSYGYECAVPQTPGVYVDVHYHQRWIRFITGIK